MCHVVSLSALLLGKHEPQIQEETADEYPA